MLDRFYELNKWDRETGWPTEKGLKELGLGEIAKRLKKAGRLK
jgi:aldehyde:ferredoxin oxidoreductase